MATLSDISKITGVSISTVSRVLNEQPGVSIPNDIREFIFQTAEKLNYQVKTGKRTVGKNKIRKLAVIGWFNEERDINIPYYSLIRHGIEMECRALGLDGSSLHFEWSDSVRNYATFLDYDGVIVIGQNHDAANYFKEKELRVVFVDHSPDPLRYDAIVADLADGTRQALSHFLAIGYTNIGYLGGTNEVQEARIVTPRFATFKSFLESKELYNPELVQLTGDWTVKTGYSMAKACLASEKVARAYFIANDPMAIGAMQAFLDEGLRIPQDVAIIGFDDIHEMSAYVRPPLTSVRVPAEALGRMAADQLINGMSFDSLPVKVTLPTRLVIRESCGFTKESD